MSLVQNNLICRCFYSENYFIKRLKLHVRFCGRYQFMQTYRHVRRYVIHKGITLGPDLQNIYDFS